MFSRFFETANRSLLPVHLCSMITAILSLFLHFPKDVEAIQGLLDTLEHQEHEIANLKHELSKASDFKDFDPVSVNVLRHS